MWSTWCLSDWSITYIYLFSTFSAHRILLPTVGQNLVIINGDFAMFVASVWTTAYLSAARVSLILTLSVCPSPLLYRPTFVLKSTNIIGFSVWKTLLYMSIFLRKINLRIILKISISVIVSPFQLHVKYIYDMRYCFTVPKCNVWIELLIFPMFFASSLWVLCTLRLSRLRG